MKPFEDGKSFARDVKNSDVVRVYWREAKNYKLLIFLTLAGMLTSALVDILAPIYLKNIVDLLTKAGPDRDWSGPFHYLTLWAGVVFISWVGMRVSSIANTYFQIGVKADLKNRAFESLLFHSYNFFTSNFTGALVARINRLSNAFETFADQITWSILPPAIKVVGFVIVIYWYSPPIAFGLLGWIVLFVFFNVIFARWKMKYDIIAAEEDSASTAVFSDAIGNQSTIQLFAREHSEISYVKKTIERWKKAVTTQWNISNVTDTVQSFLYICIQILLFGFTIYYWHFDVVTIGFFVMVETYVMYLINSLWDFSRVIRRLYSSFADSKEMVGIMTMSYEIADAEDAKPLIVSQGTIELSQASFSYSPTSAKVLDDLSLTIPGGQHVALVGPSGMGKSTFVKLLLRFYDLTDGGILIDGQNISHVTQESLRSQIGFVPQEPILFHRSIFDNIHYGNPQASKDAVLKAAKAAHCDEFVKKLAKGYQTMVGERGVKLSGGERQRVALARAILKNAPILVLDEATSSLDSESELFIQDALDIAMKGKTVIAIAHRLSTIKKMDRILVIRYGGISEEGTHDALLKKRGGLYARLWKLQSGGFIG